MKYFYFFICSLHGWRAWVWLGVFAAGCVGLGAWAAGCVGLPVGGAYFDKGEIE